jgi:hypothetical protein
MTPDVLEFLAADAEVGVRAIVANNSSTPVELMKRLVRDPAVEVQRALALNGAVAVDVLSELAAAPEAEVRELARQRMVEIGAVLRSVDSRTPDIRPLPLTPP